MLRLKKWRDLSLRAKGVCVVAIPAATTVAIACLSYGLDARVTIAEEWVNHTRQACEEIQRMETLEAEATAEIRAYFITGDDGFRLRLGEIFSRFDSAREKLVALTPERPTQQKRLAQIAQMARSRPDRPDGSLPPRAPLRHNRPFQFQRFAGERAACCRACRRSTEPPDGENN